MWSSLSVSHEGDLVLKRLKQQLANLSCKCEVCEKYNVTSMHEGISLKKPKDPCRPTEETTKSGQPPCPGCFVAYNLLQRTDKIYKDEESSANIVKISLDKSMQKTVSGLDRTTSMTKKSVKYSDSAIIDIVNETDSFEENHKNVEQINHVTGQNVGHCLCLENFIDSIRPPLKYSHY